MCGLRIVVQASVAHVRRDADDLPLTFLGKLLHDAGADHDPIVERIAVLPELARHGFVDDDDCRRQAVVAIRKGPSALDGNLEHVEVARRHREPGAAAMEGPLLERASQDAEWQPIPALERDAAGRRRAFDTGDRLKSLHTITHQLLDTRSLPVLRTGQRHAHRQHVARVEPRVHVAQCHKRSDEKRGSHQQQQGERDFDDDENRASLVVAEALRPIVRCCP